MKRFRHSWTALLCLLILPWASTAATLKINGSTTVNLPVAEAAEILRAEKKLDIQIDTQGGSSGGISALGDGLVQIGMSSKHLNDSDRAKYPKVDFREIHVGEDAVALIVSRDVWDGGARKLTRAQVKDIYEGRTTNWRDVGGPNRRMSSTTRSRDAELGRSSRTGCTGTRRKRPWSTSPRSAGTRKPATKSPPPVEPSPSSPPPGRMARKSSR